MLQRRDPNSMLNRIERLIRMRKECPEFGTGQVTVLPSSDPAIFAHCCTDGAGTVAAVHNLSGEPKKARLDLTEEGARRVTEVIGDHPYEDLPGTSPDLKLEPYGYRWFRIDAIRP
jgi:maltose alpha-D-glucosyltransferase/alpha-amylase